MGLLLIVRLKWEPLVEGGPFWRQGALSLFDLGSSQNKRTQNK